MSESRFFWRKPPTANRQPPTANRQPPTANRQPPTANRQLPLNSYMRYQDQIVRRTQSALDDVVRATRALPEDRLDWSPGGAARSALAQMREIAQTGDRFLPLIVGDARGFEGHAAREESAPTGSESLDMLVDMARAGVARLCQAIMAIPDAELEQEITLPFGGGMVMTLADALGLPAWNMTYHLGQINLIGLILGDRRMY